MRGDVIPALAAPRPRSTGAPAPWIALAGGIVVCAAITVFAAPDGIDTTRVLASGSSDARAALQAALARQLPDGVEIDTTPVGVSIDVRYGSMPFAAVLPSGHTLAVRAIADVLATRQPLPTPITAVDPRLALLTAQRAGLQSELSDADHDAVTLSSAYSETTRNIANLQHDDSVPVTNPAADPIRVLLAQVQMRRIDLAAKYTADFPGIAIADGEIGRLQELARQQKPRAPFSQAALATLRGEQSRLQTALDEATSRHTALTTRITGVDANLAAAVAAPPPPPPPPVPSYLIQDEGTFVFADNRPWLCSVAMALALALAGWCASRRRQSRYSGFAQHILAIESTSRLPVLRCLDSNGRSIGLESALTPVTAGVLALER